MDNNLGFNILDTEAASIHEIFISYVKAGFTRAEALQITIALVTNAQNINAMKNQGEAQ